MGLRGGGDQQVAEPKKGGYGFGDFCCTVLNIAGIFTCIACPLLGVGMMIMGCVICVFTGEDNDEEDPNAALKSRVEREQNAAEKNCKDAVKNTKDIVDDIKKDPQAYKNQAYMRRIFSNLNSYRNTIDSSIKHLKQVKNNIEDEYADFEVSGLNDSISDREKNELNYTFQKFERK